MRSGCFIMTIYKNSTGKSGVSQYEYGNDYIKIQFSTGTTYLYNYSSAGKENIEHMKKLADQGAGLNAFINTTVKYKYVH